MKIRVLLAGRNAVVMDDFFYNMSEVLECQSTSTRVEDINSHLRYFKPDIFMYCLKDEAEEVLERISEVFRKLKKLEVSCGIIGDNDKCEKFTSTVKEAPDLVLARPLTAKLIMDTISKFIQEKRENATENTDEETAPESAAQAPAAAKAKGKPARRHVTVIDDDLRMLRVVKEYLHGEYDVATAINSKTAMKFLESKSTDIILLDYVMPDEDGPAVYAKIRALPAHEKTPIVFLTGMSEREKIHKVMELHPQGYLLKPIVRERLIETIENLLNK